MIPVMARKRSTNVAWSTDFRDGERVESKGETRRYALSSILEWHEERRRAKSYDQPTAEAGRASAAFSSVDVLSALSKTRMWGSFKD